MREGQQNSGGTVAELPQPKPRGPFVWQHPQALHKIKFRCPTCGKHLHAELAAVGRLGRCPVCTTEFRIRAVERAG